MKVWYALYLVHAVWSNGAECYSLRKVPTTPSVVKYWNVEFGEIATTTVKNIFHDELTKEETEYIKNNVRVVG